jgi:branched-chain amino acid transport system permease protein
MTSHDSLAEASHRLTGSSTRLDFEDSRGKVSSRVRRGRPTLYTSYAADQGLLNTPAKRYWTAVLLVIAVAAPFWSPPT